jgi:hypothetical protein
MAYIIVFMWFPHHKSPEFSVIAEKVIGKIYPTSDDLDLGINTLPTAFTSDKEGIFSITAFEPKEGKMGEFLARLTDILGYYHSIEGLRYEIKTFSTMEEYIHNRNLSKNFK